MGRKRRHWKRRRWTVPWRRLWLAAILLALAAACVSGYGNLKELIAVYGENRCRNLVTQVLLDAAAETQMPEKLSCLTTVDDKSFLQLDAAAVRQYQAAVGTCLTQKLDALQRHTQRVSVGTVLDNAFLMERGPRIAIRYVPVGAAQVRIGSSLEEAGVNQVLYRVTLELAVDMTVLVPGGTRAVQCAQQIILEETLLTGRVPMFYGE